MKRFLPFKSAAFLLLIANSLFATSMTPVNEVFANADLTITVKNPHFSVGGQSMPVSSSSHPYGVCRLLGLHAAVENGILASQETFNTVKLDHTSAFSGFVKGPKVEMAICHGGGLSVIYCTRHLRGNVVRSSRDTRLAECEGPWVGTEFHRYYISYDIDIPAFCDRYFPGSRVFNSYSKAKTKGATLVRLDNHGKFIGFTNGGEQIGSISCEK